MNKIGVILFVLLFSLAFVSAIENNIKTEYKPGETILITFKGNFITPIQIKDISFYSGRIFIPLVSDLSVVNETYYLYAILPKNERDYTMKIKNAHYYQQGSERLEDLEFNFTAKGNVTDFSIDPGYIVTDKDFNIKVDSYNNLNIMYNYLNSSNSFSLNDGQSKILSFSVSDIENYLETHIDFTGGNTQYSIPVFIFKNKSTAIIKPSLRIVFTQDYYNFSVVANKTLTDSIILINLGENNLSTVSLRSELPINFSLQNFSLDVGKIQRININILSNKNLSGKIIVFAEDYQSQVPIEITAFSNEEDYKTAVLSQNTTSQLTNCSSMNGKICNLDEDCSVSEKKATDGWCCTGTCTKEAVKKTGTNTITIIVIVVIILIFLIVGFLLIKKLRDRNSTSSILKNKESEFESRFKPIESKGSLTRI